MRRKKIFFCVPCWGWGWQNWLKVIQKETQNEKFFSFAFFTCVSVINPVSNCAHQQSFKAPKTRFEGMEFLQMFWKFVIAMFTTTSIHWTATAHCFPSVDECSAVRWCATSSLKQSHSFACQNQKCAQNLFSLKCAIPISFCLKHFVPQHNNVCKWHKKCVWNFFFLLHLISMTIDLVILWLTTGKSNKQTQSQTWSVFIHSIVWIVANNVFFRLWPMTFFSIFLMLSHLAIFFAFFLGNNTVFPLDFSSSCQRPLTQKILKLFADIDDKSFVWFQLTLFWPQASNKRLQQLSRFEVRFWPSRWDRALADKFEAMRTHLMCFSFSLDGTRKLSVFQPSVTSVACVDRNWESPFSIVGIKPNEDSNLENVAPSRQAHKWSRSKALFPWKNCPRLIQSNTSNSLASSSQSLNASKSPEQRLRGDWWMICSRAHRFQKELATVWLQPMSQFCAVQCHQSFVLVVVKPLDNVVNEGANLETSTKWKCKKFFFFWRIQNCFHAKKENRFVEALQKKTFTQKFSVTHMMQPVSRFSMIVGSNPLSGCAVVPAVTTALLRVKSHLVISESFLGNSGGPTFPSAKGWSSLLLSFCFFCSWSNPSGSVHLLQLSTSAATSSSLHSLTMLLIPPWVCINQFIFCNWIRHAEAKRKWLPTVRLVPWDVFDLIFVTNFKHCILTTAQKHFDGCFKSIENPQFAQWAQTNNACEFFFLFAFQHSHWSWGQPVAFSVVDCSMVCVTSTKHKRKHFSMFCIWICHPVCIGCCPLRIEFPRMKKCSRSSNLSFIPPGCACECEFISQKKCWHLTNFQLVFFVVLKITWSFFHIFSLDFFACEHEIFSKKSKNVKKKRGVHFCVLPDPHCCSGISTNELMKTSPRWVLQKRWSPSRPCSDEKTGPTFVFVPLRIFLRSSGEVSPLQPMMFCIEAVVSWPKKTSPRWVLRKRRSPSRPCSDGENRPTFAFVPLRSFRWSLRVVSALQPMMSKHQGVVSWPKKTSSRWALRKRWSPSCPCSDGKTGQILRLCHFPDSCGNHEWFHHFNQWCFALKLLFLGQRRLPHVGLCEKDDLQVVLPQMAKGANFCVFAPSQFPVEFRSGFTTSTNDVLHWSCCFLAKEDFPTLGFAKKMISKSSLLRWPKGAQLFCFCHFADSCGNQEWFHHFNQWCFALKLLFLGWWRLPHVEFCEKDDLQVVLAQMGKQANFCVFATSQIPAEIRSGFTTSTNDVLHWSCCFLTNENSPTLGFAKKMISKSSLLRQQNRPTFVFVPLLCSFLRSSGVVSPLQPMMFCIEAVVSWPKETSPRWVLRKRWSPSGPCSDGQKGPTLLFLPLRSFPAEFRSGFTTSTNDVLHWSCFFLADEDFPTLGFAKKMISKSSLLRWENRPTFAFLPLRRFLRKSGAVSPLQPMMFCIEAVVSWPKKTSPRWVLRKRWSPSRPCSDGKTGQLLCLCPFAAVSCAVQEWFHHFKPMMFCIEAVVSWPKKTPPRSVLRKRWSPSRPCSDGKTGRLLCLCHFAFSGGVQEWFCHFNQWCFALKLLFLGQRRLPHVGLCEKDDLQVVLAQMGKQASFCVFCHFAVSGGVQEWFHHFNQWCFALKLLFLGQRRLPQVGFCWKKNHQVVLAQMTKGAKFCVCDTSSQFPAEFRSGFTTSTNDVLHWSCCFLADEDFPTLGFAKKMISKWSLLRWENRPTFAFLPLRSLRWEFRSGFTTSTNDVLHWSCCFLAKEDFPTLGFAKKMISKSSLLRWENRPTFLFVPLRSCRWSSGVVAPLQPMMFCIEAVVSWPKKTSPRSVLRKRWSPSRPCSDGKTGQLLCLWHFFAVSCGVQEWFHHFNQWCFALKLLFLGQWRLPHVGFCEKDDLQVILRQMTKGANFCVCAPSQLPVEFRSGFNTSTNDVLHWSCCFLAKEDFPTLGFAKKMISKSSLLRWENRPAFAFLPLRRFLRKSGVVSPLQPMMFCIEAVVSWLMKTSPRWVLRKRWSPSRPCSDGKTGQLLRFCHFAFSCGVQEWFHHFNQWCFALKLLFLGQRRLPHVGFCEKDDLQVILRQMAKQANFCVCAPSQLPVEFWSGFTTSTNDVLHWSCCFLAKGRLPHVGFCEKCDLQVVCSGVVSPLQPMMFCIEAVVSWLMKTSPRWVLRKRWSPSRPCSDGKQSNFLCLCHFAVSGGAEEWFHHFNQWCFALKLLFLGQRRLPHVGLCEKDDLQVVLPQMAKGANFCVFAPSQFPVEFRSGFTTSTKHVLHWSCCFLAKEDFPTLGFAKKMISKSSLLRWGNRPTFAFVPLRSFMRESGVVSPLQPMMFCIEAVVSWPKKTSPRWVLRKRWSPSGPCSDGKTGQLLRFCHFADSCGIEEWFHQFNLWCFALKLLFLGQRRLPHVGFCEKDDLQVVFAQMGSQANFCVFATS